MSIPPSTNGSVARCIPHLPSVLFLAQGLNFLEHQRNFFLLFYSFFSVKFELWRSFASGQVERAWEWGPRSCRWRQAERRCSVRVHIFWFLWPSGPSFWPIAFLLRLTPACNCHRRWRWTKTANGAGIRSWRRHHPTWPEALRAQQPRQERQAYPQPHLCHSARRDLEHLRQFSAARALSYKQK